MCHLTDATTATRPDDDSVVPFLRPAVAAAGAQEPPRPPNASHIAIDELSEARALLGLTLLAAEALPSGHSIEFMSVLEVIHSRLGSALGRLRAPASPLPREA